VRAKRAAARSTRWMSNLAIVRRYHEILAAERYFALSKPGTLSGGIGRSQAGMNDGSKSEGDGKTPYQFSGIDWYADPFFDPNVVVGLDTSHFFLGVGENEVPRPISRSVRGRSVLPSDVERDL
jgi:hypothetical protein